MILPALSLILHASTLDSSQRIVASLLDSIQKSRVCKQVAPVSPSSLPSTLDRGGDAKIRTVACPNGLRRTVVRWDNENSPFNQDVYLEDLHGLLFQNSTKHWPLQEGSNDSFVEQWIYRTSGRSMAYSSIGSAASVPSTQFDSGLANIADRIFWNEGGYRSLSESLARSLGLPRGFRVSPPQKCSTTRFPRSSARRTWSLLASGLDQPTDSATQVTLDELRCEDSSSFVVGQAEFSRHRSQITIGRRFDSLKFVLFRRRSSDQEWEHILIPDVSRTRTWWRTSEQLDAVYPIFVTDSTSPSNKALLEILGQLSRVPKASSIDSLREDSARREVIQRQAAIDQAILQHRCEELPMDPLPALDPIANRNPGEASARIFLCPQGIGNRFVQTYDSIQPPLEIRLESSEQGMIAFGMGKPDTSNPRLESNLLLLDNKVRSVEAPMDARKRDRGTLGLDAPTWRRIDSTLADAVSGAPHLMIGLDGFLFLEASPEITSDRPVRRRGDWNVQEIEAKSVPAYWATYRKRTLRTWGGDPKKPDTIVGFCLVSVADIQGSEDAEEPSSENQPSTTYLAAKLSGKANLHEPRLLGLSTLLPEKPRVLPATSNGFDTWTRELEERALIYIDARFQQEQRKSSPCEEVSTPEGNTPEFGQSTWVFVDSLESYFFSNRTKGRYRPCESNFDASYSIAAFESAQERDPPFRDIFAPPPPGLPTLAESDTFDRDPEPGRQEIRHPCDDLDAFECGIHNLTKAKATRRVQALVESRGDRHLVSLREWDGSRWTTTFEIDRPQEPPTSYGGCD